MKKEQPTADLLQVNIEQDATTYERFFIMACIHSHRFYLSIKEKVCPWDPIKTLRRRDFSTEQYNYLFDVIANHWELFRGKVSEFPIKQRHLDTHVVDAHNAGKIPTNVTAELREEIADDFYSHEMTQEFIDTVVAGEALKKWMEIQLGRHMLRSIQNRHGMVTTVENVEEIIKQYKKDLPSDKNENLMAGDVMKRKIILTKKIPSGITALDAALGGGFGRGTTTIVAGGSGTGKTVFACQLALEFAKKERKVVYVTTEQTPEQLLLRFIANYAKVRYELLTNRNEVQSDGMEEVEADPIPAWLYTDANTAEAMAKLEDFLKRNVCFMDWSSGMSKTVMQDFDPEIEAIMQRGFTPEAVIFDWIGGGIQAGGDDRLHEIYDATANHLINYGKRTKQAVIAMVQLDEVVSKGKRCCGPTMVSNCKSMHKNAWNFIGISALQEAGSNTSFSIRQNLHVGKARDGITGANVPVDRAFMFQKFAQANNIVSRQQ